MTVTDQLKILDIKVFQNEAQYDLDRKAAKISALSSNNLDKYKYLTGEDLGLKPSTVEQAKFEYSPLGKIFGKGLDKNEDEKEGLFKILKNIAGKIKSEDKKQSRPIKNKDQSEPIKNEEQSEETKDQSTITDNKPEAIVLLKDRLDYLFKSFGSYFNSNGKNFLKKLAKDEEKIDYNNLFFNADDKSAVKSVNFLEEVGTLYDLLIYLLGNAKRILNSPRIPIDFFKAIHVLKRTISSMKTDITDKSGEQKKEIFAEQESVLNNAILLLEKRGEIIDQFTKNNITSRGVKFFDAPEKIKKSTPKTLSQKNQFLNR